MHSASILPLLRDDLSGSLSCDTILLFAFPFCSTVTGWDLVHWVRALGFAKQQQANTSRHARHAVIGAFARYVCEVDALPESVAIERRLEDINQ